MEQRLRTYIDRIGWIMVLLLIIVVVIAKY